MNERDIFVAALQEDDAAERQAYLDNACGTDIALRQHVEGLLQVYGKAGSFLEPPRRAPAATLDEPITERPGTVIGPYKLLEQIGEGGFGVVFMAEQHQPMRRKVALKVLKPGMDTRQVVARFEAERQALALMDHPNIAHVLDGGETDSGRPYFVMELVRGIPVTDFCDQNHLSVRERLELFVHVCQAVQHAHHKGVIHRDLKPSNIMVTMHDATPVVKVIDFGIAKATGQQLTDKTLFTNFAQMIGTPMYMSPEQAQMSGLDMDTRTDIYSLGVLLYELLTGTTPFDKERLRTAAYDEIRRIIREEEPARPSRRLSTPSGTRGSQADRTSALQAGRMGHDSSVELIAANRGSDAKRLCQLFRGELDWIVMKALEKDRSRRYETAKDFAADVERYLKDEAVQACPPTLSYRLRKLARRHKGPVLAASLVLLALVGGIIGTTWGLLRATVARTDAVNEARQKEVALQDKEVALEDKEAALAATRQSERDAKDSLWLSLYEQARARRFSRQMGQRLDSLDALAKAARLHTDERLRDEAIAAMALPDIRLGPTWHAWPPGHYGWAIDAQYRLYARVSDKGVISIRSVPDDREIRSFVGPSTKVNGVSLSPDGRYLVASDDGSTLWVCRVADGKEVMRVEPNPIGSWNFSPDSRQFVVGKQGWILRFDLATGRELNRWQLPQNMHAYFLAFHPDNSKLAVGYVRSNVASVYDAASGALLTDLPVGAMTNSVVAWDPDGGRLAVTGSNVNPVIQIWDVTAKRKVAMLEGHSQYVGTLSFHPDGDLLASASWDGVVRLWHPSTGQQLMQLPISANPQFSSDGRWLGIAPHGEQAQLLEVTATREYRTLVSSLGAAEGGYNLDSDISPDGQLLAQNMNDAVRLWHLASGRELAVLPPGRPLFQSNGELLIAGDGGLHRWPIQPLTPSPLPGGERGRGEGELRLGPPRIIPVPSMPTRNASLDVRADRSQDGQTLAIVSDREGTGMLVDLATDFVRAPLLGHPRVCFVALSRDGRWMASSGWHSDRVRLWSAETGKMVHEWVLSSVSAMVFFTPDSRELIISRRDEFGFHDVETLKPSRRIRRDVSQYPGHLAFSPDGGLMALEMAPGIVHLQDAATAKTVAKLEDPHGDRAGWMSFTPDGTQLVVSAPYARAVHVWDLRAIRHRLKGMDLDWDWPEFEPADSVAQVAAPMKVEVLLGDLAQPTLPALTREQKAQQAIEQYRSAVEANSDDATACNDLAWAYVTAPESLRDVNAALPLAEKAVRLASGPGDRAIFRNTLGLVYYRAGRYREATDCLEQNLNEQEDWALAFDLYVLAMSCHKLDEPARARDYHVLANRWVDSRANREQLTADQQEELAAFRRETEEVLRVHREEGESRSSPR